MVGTVPDPARRSGGPVRPGSWPSAAPPRGAPGGADSVFRNTVSSIRVAPLQLQLVAVPRYCD
eukprot:7764317-Pyramimonas_sp.AAC.1